MGTLDQLRESYARVLACLMSFEKRPGTEYQTAITTQLFMFMWMKAVDHPAMRLMNADVNVMNEERGEISFSVLARAINGSSIRRDIKIVSDLYRLSKQQMETAKALRFGTDADDTIGRSDAVIGLDGDDIKAATEHFKHVTRAMRARTWRPYDTEAKQWESAVQARGAASPDLSPMTQWRRVPTKNDIKVVIEKAAKQTRGQWANQFSDIWPELASDDVFIGERNLSDPIVHDVEPADEQPPDDIKVPRPNQPRQKKRKKRGQPIQHACDGDSQFALEIAIGDGEASPSNSESDNEMAASGVASTLYVPRVIHAARTVRRQKQYLIEWVDFPEEREWTWEKATAYDNDRAFDDLVAQWKAEPPQSRRYVRRR